MTHRRRTTDLSPNVVDLRVHPSARGRRGAARPFVLVNMAMTADGKIATANRAVASFGSQRDLAHLYKLRATVDAVMCGARTIEAGEVHLGPGGVRHQQRRLKAGLAEFNLRVVVSGSGSVDTTAHIFTEHFSPILVLTTARAGRRRLAALARVADEVMICGDRTIDFATAIEWLATRWRVKRLLCEGGGKLNAAMLGTGLVQELHLTLCPLVFGGSEAPTIASGIGAKTLGDATRLRLQRVRRVGDELFCVFAVLPVKETGTVAGRTPDRSSAARDADDQEVAGRWSIGT